MHTELLYCQTPGRGPAMVPGRIQLWERSGLLQTMPSLPSTKPAFADPMRGVLPIGQAQCYGYSQFLYQPCKLHVITLTVPKKGDSSIEQMHVVLSTLNPLFLLVIAPWCLLANTLFHICSLGGLHSTSSLPRDKRVRQAGPTALSSLRGWMLRAGRQRLRMTGAGSAQQDANRETISSCRLDTGPAQPHPFQVLLLSLALIP